MLSGDALTKGHYYPAIDGLRTLAVLAVIGYHGSKQLASGGFIGVDVFFVISGFVITLTLLREFDRTGRIALWPFYTRRFWRLAPAMVVAILFAALIAAAFSIGSVHSFLWQALTGVTYTYNIAQVVTADRGGGLLSHLWSLAVEEQFYLVWAPLLGLGLGIYTARRTRLAVVAILAATFFGARIATYILLGDLAAFFLPWARFDQFMIGALAALLAHHSRGSLPAIVTKAWVPAVALLLIVGGVVLISDLLDPWLYLGGYTAIAMLAAILVLHGYSSKPTFINAFLSWGPMVWLGQRSYGIYLFHYPVEQAIRTLPIHPLLHPLITLVVGTAIAALSYKYVETPLRRLGARTRTSAPPLPAVESPRP